jgi:hypothetical protein
MFFPLWSFFSSAGYRESIQKYMPMAAHSRPATAICTTMFFLVHVLDGTSIWPLAIDDISLPHLSYDRQLG